MLSLYCRLQILSLTHRRLILEANLNLEYPTATEYLSSQYQSCPKLHSFSWLIENYLHSTMFSLLFPLYSLLHQPSQPPSSRGSYSQPNHVFLSQRIVMEIGTADSFKLAGDGFLRRRLLPLALLIILFTANSAGATDTESESLNSRPLATSIINDGLFKNWNLGVGLTAYRIPDYNGSSHSTNIFTPTPYLSYRGKFVKVTNGKITGTLFSSQRWFLNISADGSPPIKSDKNTARSGMPDLDPVLEVGPAIEYYIFKKPRNSSSLYLDIPLRAGIATDLTDLHSIGWISNPRIKYDVRLSLWKLRFGIGPTYATEAFYDYYYGIKTRYASETRNAYETNSGYGGMRYSFGFSRPINDFRFSGYIRIIDLSGANFRSSTLVESRHPVLAGLSIIWIFY